MSWSLDQYGHKKCHLVLFNFFSFEISKLSYLVKLHWAAFLHSLGRLASVANHFEGFSSLFKAFQVFSRPQPGKANLYVCTEWGVMYWNQFYIEQLSFIHPVASVANKLQLFKAFQGSQPGKATLCVYRLRRWSTLKVCPRPLETDPKWICRNRMSIHAQSSHHVFESHLQKESRTILMKT